MRQQAERNPRAPLYAEHAVMPAQPAPDNTIPIGLPLVSVYIPTRNRLELLRRAVDSVLMQSYARVELVVADDGSTDGTRDYLEELAAAGKIRTVMLQSSMGACVARNMALFATTGDFVTGLDDDDYFLPNRISDFVNRWRTIASQSVPVAGLFTPATMLGVSGSRVVSQSASVSLGELRRANLVGNNVFAPRAHYFDAGLFDPAMPCWQDWDLWVRMAQRYGAFIGGGEPTYVWDQSAPVGHISNRPEFQIRYGYSLFSHKQALKSRSQSIGALGAMTMYPQVRLSPGEIASLTLSTQWSLALRYLVSRMIGRQAVQRLRLLIGR